MIIEEYKIFVLHGNRNDHYKTYNALIHLILFFAYVIALRLYLRNFRFPITVL